MMKKDHDIFLSIRGRVLVNVEALNMTESVGNYVKHRRVPVIMPGTYTTYFVPAISGESIAHGYQAVLAEEVENKNLPICNLCKKKIFLKSTNMDTITSGFLSKEKEISDWLEIKKEEWDNMVNIKNKKEKEKKERLQIFEQQIIPHKLESSIIANCVVEDVGGFLYAEQKFFKVFNIGGVKRTSNFYVGYMIPVKEALGDALIEPQLHSRYALGTTFVKREQRGQMLYYVELSSAAYSFSFDLDSKFIGKTTFVLGEAGKQVTFKQGNDNRKERISVSLDAVSNFLLEMLFGAKKTRFLPIVDWESIVIALSDDVWTTPSPFTANYVENSLRKLEKTDENTKLFVYINPAILEDTSVYVKKKTEELLNSFYEALEDFKKRLVEKGDANIVDWQEFKKKKLEEFLDRKVNELVESSDLKYVSKIQKKYENFIEMAKGKEDKVKIYYNFEECVKEALKEGKSRVSKE